MDWPDWRDCGRLIRLWMPTGHIVRGLLTAEEFWTGEDEVPIFSVEVNGKVYSLSDAAKFEFLD